MKPALEKKRALFLDRDGIFNEVVFRAGKMHSPKNWDEIRHYPMEGIESLKSLGFKLILITNQPDVERGIVSVDFLKELHEFYQTRYQLDAVYYCPFAAESHPWKKPNTGMFEQATKDFGLSLCDSFHLGDTERDVDAAKRCGCKSLLWDRPYNQGLKADYRISSLSELRSILTL